MYCVLWYPGLLTASYHIVENSLPSFRCITIQEYNISTVRVSFKIGWHRPGLPSTLIIIIIIMVIIGFHWFSLGIFGFHWFSLIFIGFHWFLLIFIGFKWLSLVKNGIIIIMVIIGFHWFSLGIFGFH